MEFTLKWMGKERFQYLKNRHSCRRHEKNVGISEDCVRENRNWSREEEKYGEEEI